MLTALQAYDRMLSRDKIDFGSWFRRFRPWVAGSIVLGPEMAQNIVAGRFSGAKGWFTVHQQREAGGKGMGPGSSVPSVTPNYLHSWY